MPVTDVKPKKRVFHLTSPLMRGDDVKVLQHELITHGFLDDRADSEYGPLTAQAVERAKYTLGYPQKYVNQTAESGGLLVNLLSGKKKPTPSMVSTAKRRASQVPLKSIGTKMLDHAKLYIGITENPRGSNVCQFSEWYMGLTHAQARKAWTPSSPGPAWCAMFVSYNGVKTGSKAFKQGITYAYCPYILNDAVAGRNYLSIVTKPEYGDLALYDWQRDGIVDHVEFFEKWITKTTFSSVGGNTGWSDQSNGGEVQHRVPPHERYNKNVRAFVRINA